MKTILILGGTRFFGRALIGKLLKAEGNPPDIVCFHRGFHQADFPFPGVSHIIGDRHDASRNHPGAFMMAVRSLKVCRQYGKNTTIVNALHKYNDTMDAVLAIHVISHGTPEVIEKGYVREMHRILKPGGVLAVTIPSLDDARCAAQTDITDGIRSFAFTEGAEAGIIHSFYSEEAALKLFREFEVLKMEEIRKRNGKRLWSGLWLRILDNARFLLYVRVWWNLQFYITMWGSADYSGWTGPGQNRA